MSFAPQVQGPNGAVYRLNMCGGVQRSGSCELSIGTQGAIAVCADPSGIVWGMANTTVELYDGVVRVRMEGSSKCPATEAPYVAVIKIMCDPAAGRGSPRSGYVETEVVVA